MKYYLRMEGVNLSNFVYDTQDLSTIRGGGLLLLDAIERVKKGMTGISMEPISTGASAGLFSFEADDRQAEKARTDVEKLLTSDPALKHATFVVDIIPSKGDDRFKEDRELLIAGNRLRQMQSPSVVFPGKGAYVCEVDMVRSSNRKHNYKDKKDVPISDSVISRRQYGIEQKQAFYHSITEVKDAFVYDLNELTEDLSKKNLHHKMAVIYIDGNDFGKIQSGLKAPDDLTAWDSMIKDYRNKLLKALLDEIRDQTQWLTTKDGEKRIRFETLLWGGDELLWVVPAWVGWWTLAFFFHRAKGWPFGENILKHAAGIVFCHHKAPIHRVKDLAKALAEKAKDKDRNRNLFAYQVLESFDHLGHDIDKYRQCLCPAGTQLSDLILDGEKMSDIANEILKLKYAEFPRSKLHAITQYLLKDKKSEAEEHIKKVQNLSDDIKKSLENLTGLFNGEHMRWLHIADLWDYALDGEGSHA